MFSLVFCTHVKSPPFLYELAKIWSDEDGGEGRVGEERKGGEWEFPTKHAAVVQMFLSCWPSLCWDDQNAANTYPLVLSSKETSY